MIVVKNSVVIQFFVTLWCFLSDAAKQSKVGALFVRWGEGFSATIQGSALCQFVWREGRMPRGWTDSLCYRIASVLINVPGAVLRAIYQRTQGIWEGSYLCRLVMLVGGCTAVLMGLFVAAMLATPHDSWNNIYALLAVVALALLYVVTQAKEKDYRLDLASTGPYLFLYMGIVCYGLVASISTSLSLRFFLFHLTGVFIILVVVSATKRYEQIEGLVILAVIGVTVAAIYGCYQGVIGVEVVASQQDMSLNADMPGRVYGFFDNPNNFAEVLVMLIPLDLALIFNVKSLSGKVFSVLALVPCLLAIGFTYSRSGWIGLAIGVLVFLAFQNWRIVPAVLVMGVVAVPFLPESIYNRILTIGNMEDTSLQYRFAIYESVANLLKDYWYQGVGLGNDAMTKVFEQGYPTLFDGNYPIHTHNNYLQMWAEVGILGAINYLALILWQLKAGVKAFCASSDRRLRNMLAASIGAFCGILVIGVAEYTWFYPRNMFTYFLLIAIICACVKLAKGEKKGQMVETC